MFYICKIFDLNPLEYLYMFYVRKIFDLNPLEYLYMLYIRKISDFFTLGGRGCQFMLW